MGGYTTGGDDEVIGNDYYCEVYRQEPLFKQDKIQQNLKKYCRFRALWQYVLF